MNLCGINTLAEAALHRKGGYFTNSVSSSHPMLNASVSKILPTDPHLLVAMVARRQLLSSLSEALPTALPVYAEDHTATYLALLNGQGTSNSVNYLNSARTDAASNSIDTTPNQGADHSAKANYASMIQAEFDSTITAPSRKRKPNFAEKLHAVLSSKECQYAISWLPSGRSFCITDQKEFAKNILPKYFREAKFGSFTRRLKRWQFRKVFTSGLSQVIFSHDLFHRDRPDFCKIMCCKEKVSAAAAAAENIPEARSCANTASLYTPRRHSLKAMFFQRAKFQQQELESQQQMRMRAASFSSDSSPLQVPSYPTKPSPTILPGISNSPEVVGSQGVHHNLTCLNLSKDIADCEERLAILQRVRELNGLR
jgi:hypothetical protein